MADYSTNNKIKRLHDSLRHMAVQLGVERDNPLLEDVKPLDSSIINLLLLGEYGLDKISFAGKIIGKDIFFDEMLPSDNYLVRLNFGDKPKSILSYGAVKKEQFFSHIEPINLQLKHLNKSEINQIEIDCPSEILEQHQIIIIPGLGDINPAHSLLISEYFQYSSGVILIIDFDYGLRSADKEALLTLSLVMDRIFVYLSTRENKSSENKIIQFNKIKTEINFLIPETQVLYFEDSTLSDVNNEIKSLDALKKAIRDVKFSEKGYLIRVAEAIKNILKLNESLLARYKLQSEEIQFRDEQDVIEKKERSARLIRVIQDQIRDLTLVFEQSLVAIKFKLLSQNNSYTGNYIDQIIVATQDINTAKNNVVGRIDDIEKMIRSRVSIDLDNVLLARKSFGGFIKYKNNYFEKITASHILGDRLLYSAGISGAFAIISFLFFTPSF